MKKKEKHKKLATLKIFSDYHFFGWQPQTSEEWSRFFIQRILIARAYVMASWTIKVSHLASMSLT